MLALSRAQFRTRQARRLRHPAVGGRNILFARDGKGTLQAPCSTPARIAARRSAAKSTATQIVPVLLPRLGVRPRWRAAQPARRSPPTPTDFKERSDLQHAAGHAVRELPRFQLHLLRQGCRKPLGLSRAGEGISRRDLRSGRDRHDHRRRHAGIFDARQLEAADRKLDRRLSRADHACDLSSTI